MSNDRNILTSVAIAFETEGYRIMRCTDGVSALGGFKTGPPDLSITDNKMQRMHGMKTPRYLLRRRPRVNNRYFNITQTSSLTLLSTLAIS